MITDWIQNINQDFLIRSIGSSIIYIILGIILSSFISSIINRTFKKETGSNRRKTLLRVTASIIRYVVWFIVLLLILEAFNVDTNALLGAAGILGLAFGLGAQGLIDDFLSGFFILFEESFQVGDVIEVDGFVGEVVDIGLRTTKIKNWKGILKVINNGDIKSVVNRSKFNTLAIVDFDVAYETELPKLNELLVEFINNYKHELLVEDLKYLGLMELKDSGIKGRIIGTCKPNQHYGVERDIREELVKFFNKSNIEIPFPQIVVNKKG